MRDGEKEKKETIEDELFWRGGNDDGQTETRTASTRFPNDRRNKRRSLEKEEITHYLSHTCPKTRRSSSAYANI